MKRRSNKYPTVAKVGGLILLFVLGFIAVGQPTAIAGGKEPFTPIIAKVLIGPCWALSKEDRDSGVTARMRSSTARTAGCLKEVILDQAEAMVEPVYLSRQMAQNKLDMIRKGYSSLYWSIYNEHRECERWCGTDRTLYHLGAYTTLLEDIIHDMVNERNDIKF